MINYFKSTPNQPKLKKIGSFQAGCWINVINPTPRELDELSKIFQLDKKNLRSGLDQNELPRVDFADNQNYIFVKIIQPSTKVDLHTFLIIVTNKFILTLSKDLPSFMGSILKGEIEFLTSERPKCVMRLFSIINKEFEDATVEIVKLVSSKKTIVKKLKERDVNEVLEQEDTLNNLVTVYYYTNLLYDRIIKKMKILKTDKETLEDLVVESHQGYNLCRSSLKTISHIRNRYNILLSNRLNRVITILTIFTIFISIPAAISGLYGMNLALPLQNHFLTFYYVLAFVGAIWLVLWWYFKREGVL